MSDFLKVFYAVTLTSLYRVEYIPGKAVPVVEKIAVVGSSEIPVGEKLTGGYNVGIRRNGLVVYGTNRELPEMVNTRQWGGQSSPIVGLFLDEASARECLCAEDLKLLNPRWRKQTEATLNAIGSDHPKFIHSAMDVIRYE